MFTLIDFILSKIPGNGKKTNVSFIALGISFLLQLLSQHLPVQPSDADIQLVAENIALAIDLVSKSFEVLGLGGVFVGLFHKVVKAVIKLIGLIR